MECVCAEGRFSGECYLMIDDANLASSIMRWHCQIKFPHAPDEQASSTDEWRLFAAACQWMHYYYYFFYAFLFLKKPCQNQSLLDLKASRRAAFCLFSVRWVSETVTPTVPTKIIVRKTSWALFFRICLTQTHGSIYLCIISRLYGWTAEKWMILCLIIVIVTGIVSSYNCYYDHTTAQGTLQ